MVAILDKIAGNYIKHPEGAVLSSEAEELVKIAFSDIEAGRMLDYHMHILGLGTNDSGIWVSPDLFSLRHPSDSIKTQAYECCQYRE